MRKLCALLVLMGGTALGQVPAFADTTSDPTTSDLSRRPRAALVLSGGGARGLAHIGVLEVLEEMGIPIDCVAGTSMGALVGGAYAAGVTPQRMREVLSKSDLGALFDDLPERQEIPQRIKRDDYRPLFEFTLGFNHWQVQLPAGASAGYKFELFLKELIGPAASIDGLDFDRLPTPYRAVATDLESGAMRVFARGDLSRVMRASMSIPAIIAPAKIGDRLYVDGGLVRNLPVDIGRALCGDVVIAVNLGTPLRTRDQLHSVLDTAGQSLNLMTEENVARSLRELTDRDVLIEPDLHGLGAADFDTGTDIIALGRAAALAKAPQLSPLAVGAKEYDAWLLARHTAERPAPKITRIAVLERKEFSTGAAESDIRVKPGEEFSADALHRDLARLFGRGDFSYLGYTVVPGKDGATALIDAEPKPWGPGYLKFGLGALGDFYSPAQVNLAASYRRTWVNALGAEWRVDGQVGYDSFLRTEFIQPLQVRDGGFVAPYVGVRRNTVQFYLEDVRAGQYRVYANRAGVDAGLTGTAGELRLGPYVAEIRTSPDFGVLTPVVPADRVVEFGAQLTGVFDRLDRPVFPRSGWLMSLDAHGARINDESESRYARGVIALKGVESFGRNTLSAHVEIGGKFSDDLPAYDPFKLGGPFRLSGLFLDQLTGSRQQLGVLSYYRQYAALPAQVGRGIYLGMSLEAGRMNDALMKNPWDWVYASSVYGAADTILGALYLGYGRASLGQRVFYLMLGPRI